MEHIWPVIWIAAGVFGLLVLEHAAEIRKALFHDLFLRVVPS
jgi:hypothetical protein